MPSVDRLLKRENAASRESLLRCELWQDFAHAFLFAFRVVLQEKEAADVSIKQS